MSDQDVRAGPTPPHLVSVREACEILRLSRSTLYELMDAGRLGFVRIGRARRLAVAELQRLVTASSSPARRR